MRVDGRIVPYVQFLDGLRKDENGQVEEDDENLRANNAHLPVDAAFPAFCLLSFVSFVFVSILCEQPVVLLIDTEALVVRRRHFHILLLLRTGIRIDSLLVLL